jgi:4-oxalocrotonate tautomerase
MIFPPGGFHEHFHDIYHAPSTCSRYIDDHCPNREEGIMPLIQVNLIEEVFTPEQKRQIIKKLTDAMVEVEGEAMRGVTWVTIQEVRSGEWGIGGQPLTTADVKALAAGKAAA